MLKLTAKAALLASTFIMLACSDNGPGQSKQKKSGHLVETVTASVQQVASSRTLPGTLQAIREVQIINQAEGLLLKLPVYPGDRVKTGQTLAQLDDTLIKSEVQKAQATLSQAKVDLRRLKDLAPRKLASESEIAQAQTRKDIAAAELQLKKTEFKHSHIRSPIDGIIAARMVEPGDVIPLHSQLLSLIDTSSLKAEIRISELLLPLIEKGHQVDISIDALGNQQFAGKIQRIHPSIDKNTRRGTIEVILNPVPEGARAGQLCRVTIHTKSKSRLMIPYDTVRYDKLGAFVYTINNDQALRLNITTGLQHETLIEVLNGLEVDQEIISKGFFGLKNEMKIQRVDRKAGPADTEAVTGSPQQTNKTVLKKSHE